MENLALHAYIISGAELPQRESLASSLARKALGGKSYTAALQSTLTPKSKPADPEPHTDTAALAHPDLHEISPDGAEIKVAQAREVRELAQVRPNEAERHVFIFHDADRMNTNAQNALLATIEEPPTPCLFLFVCANERALLPTIRSRCAVLHANPDTLRGQGIAAASDPQPQIKVDRAAAHRLAAELVRSHRGQPQLQPEPSRGALNASLRSQAESAAISLRETGQSSARLADTADAALPLSKLKPDAAAAFLDETRAACLKSAASATPGSDAASKALAAADFAAKCRDMLAANVSPAQIAAYITAEA